MKSLTNDELAKKRAYQCAWQTRLYHRKLKFDPEYIERARKRAAEWYAANRLRLTAERGEKRAKRLALRAAPPGLKRCGRCNHIRPIRMFSNDRSKPDGLHTVCKPCKKKTDAAYYRAHLGDYKARCHARYLKDPKSYADQSKTWMLANPVRTKASRTVRNSRRRARLKNTICTITPREWSAILRKSRGRCFYCAIRCKLTMDHKVPLVRGGAHAASNIVAACMSCNCRKGMLTPEEFLAKQPA